MKVNYTMKGLNRFIGGLKDKPIHLSRQVDNELKNSRLRVERDAKKRAPWDTGWMSNNIYSEQLNILQHTVVSPAYYSIFVEKGTRYQRAQPFFFVALEYEYPRLMKNLQKIVKG